MTFYAVLQAASEQYAWMSHASCRTLPRDAQTLLLFYNTPPPPDILELCSSCPVRTECITYAFDHHVEHGWLGGVSPTRRRELGSPQAVFDVLGIDPPDPS